MIRPKIAGGQVPLRDLARAAGPLAAGIAELHAPVSLSKAPTFVTWAVTERCPLRCKHCDMGGAEASPELDRAGRIALAHRLAASPVWGLSLIGGEASILPELGDLVAILKDAGKWVSVGTSGLAIAKHLDAFARLGLDSITFSVDSHRPEAHDAFRGRPGLFAEVDAAILRLTSLRAEGRPQIQVRGTVHRGNFRELGDYLDYWSPRADKVLLQVVQDNGIHAVRSADDVLFRPEDRPDFERVMADIQARWPEFRTRYHKLAARYVFEPEQLYRDIGFRCLLVPAVSVTVLADASVKLCYGREDSLVGNLQESDLETIWQGVQRRQTARRMQGSDYGCMCWEQACSGNLELLRAQQVAERVLGPAQPPR